MPHKTPDDAKMTVPSRVKSTIPLVVAESTIRGAGRGIFVLEPVSARNLIFKVATPLLCIIEDGKEALQRTCDNCFATKKGVFQTIVRDDLQFKPCKGCEVLYYCGEGCQALAWERHHKAECNILSKIRQDKQYAATNHQTATIKNVRALIRLLCLHKSGMVSEAEWEEVMALKTNTDTRNAGTEEWATYLAEIAEKFEATKLSQSVVKHLVFVIFNNNLMIDQPLLRDSASYPSGNGYAATGICLEPFASLVNHSCEPNAWWVFNGCEFQLRATRDIPKGAELTISYVGSIGNYYSRQEDLLADWDILCECSLCKKGPQGPTDGPLYQRLLEFGQLVEGSSDGNALIQELQKFTDEMHGAGFNIGTWQIRSVYHQIFQRLLKRGNNIEALKIWLKLYFEIDLVAIPRLLPDDHVNSLKKLVSLIRTLQFEESPLITDDVKKVLPAIQCYLGEKVWRETEGCFGPDSTIAVFEKKEFQKYIENPGKGLEGGMLQGTALDEATYVEALGKLLDWAGVTISSKQDL